MKLKLKLKYEIFRNFYKYHITIVEIVKKSAQVSKVESFLNLKSALTHFQPLF